LDDWSLQEQLALVCVGGGRGVRFGGDKLSEQLGGHTVFAVALQALQHAFPEAPLIAVCPADQRSRWRQQLVPACPGLTVVGGGDLRQDSVRNGVTAAVDRHGAEVVAVHDAARPLVAAEDVVRVVAALGEHAGAVLCHRVADTVKRVDRQGRVLATVARDDLRLSLTPQVFRVSALVQAWQAAAAGQVWTDEAALLEAAGLSVQTVEALHPNPKITSAHDLRLIRALIGQPS
jgi:2-C-methyl-D-erythritol 4-phosphate cytidylyltransferase/2-C-methyl-D-erythritol 2,4-cyclodiphosphate synthase